jgi:hypothetical protein
MGEIADMMLDGTMCQQCGQFMGDPLGAPTTCSDCDPESNQDPKDSTVPVEPLFSLVRRVDTGEQIFMIHAAPDHPALVGMSFADCIRHFAKSYESEGVMGYAEAVVQIMAGLHEEMSSPSDEIKMVYHANDETPTDAPYLDVSDWTDEDWAMVDANRGSLTREEFVQRMAAELVSSPDLQRAVIKGKPDEE